MVRRSDDGLHTVIRAQYQWTSTSRQLCILFSGSGSDMPIRDKSWALNQFRHQRNSFLIALGGVQFIRSDAIYALLSKKVIITDAGYIFDPVSEDHVGDRYEAPLQQIVNDYENHLDDFKYSLEQFLKSARRQLFTEAYETALSYATFAGKLKELRREPWYRFSRIIRNALNHDFIFNLDKHDEPHFPVTWRHVAIEPCLNGQEITTNVLTPRIAFELHTAMELFVTTN